MASSHFNYGQQDFKTTSQGGTDPAGRPQPGAGNAGDQDKPRKSPAGPRTAAEKRALSTRKKLIGKRAATEKLSSARGRKAARLAQPSRSSRVGKKLSRKKKRDSRGAKHRVR